MPSFSLKQLTLKKSYPWFWVPSLYLAEGIPYIIAMTVSVILYKRLGLSNTDIALYTSWFYLPWVIKPFWSPFVDFFRTKRFWILVMQLAIGGSLACVALTIPADNFIRYTLAMFWIMAFSSATHDIAADGFYMLGLDTPQQAAFIGVRTVFYRVATIAAKGGLVIMAGMHGKLRLSGNKGLVDYLYRCGGIFFGSVYLSFFCPALSCRRPESAAR